MSDSRFDDAVAEFSRIHAADPSTEHVEGTARPRELAQTERVVRWVARLAPDASEALRLAAHGQHLGRYRVPRTSYPEGRVGYLQWRSELGRLHAEAAAVVLEQVGYPAEVVQQVRRIVQKQGLRHDPEVQTMEDALCLTFLEHELDDFAAKHADDKLVDILQKTWRKMSPRARELALALPLEGRARALVERAVGDAARE